MHGCSPVSSDGVGSVELLSATLAPWGGVCIERVIQGSGSKSFGPLSYSAPASITKLQTGGLTTEVCFLTVLEAGSLRSGCQHS